MCGIVGVNGKLAAYRAVNTTLAQLDRGTSSSGYTWINETENQPNRMYLTKAPVHPLELAIAQRYLMNINTRIALGHNRMPSRGEVTKENCHPFFDCENRFALVHNGTISFNNEDKNTLLNLKHRLLGETDSEMLTHVICEYLNGGMNMKEALEKVINSENTIATFLVLTKEGDIYGVKDNMPLQLCQLEDSNKGDLTIVASERQAIDMATIDMYDAKRTWTTINRGDLIHITPNNELSIIPHILKTNYLYSYAGYDNEWDIYDRYRKNTTQTALKDTQPLALANNRNNNRKIKHKFYDVRKARDFNKWLWRGE